MTIKTPLKEGDRLRLKATPQIRRNGLMVYNTINRMDTHVSAGAIGTVKRIPYTAWDKSRMAHWILEFERGHRIGLTTNPDISCVKATEAFFISDWDAKDFVRVK